jgi:cryptochrome
LNQIFNLFVLLLPQIKKAQPPLSLHGQVLWREFFYCAATNNPNFDKMIGNPICVQIPWDSNAEALAKWANVSYLLFYQVFKSLI